MLREWSVYMRLFIDVHKRWSLGMEGIKKKFTLEGAGVTPGLT